MSLQLTNSFGHRKEPFIPRSADEVRMYVCGPTVYNYAHIGNARPAVVFDVLARALRRQFPKLTYARNLTDIDDKINAAALAEGIPIGALTARYTAAYHDDMAALGNLPPSIEPKVTDHIPDIICLIERLLGEGHAYEAEAHVLFHVSSCEDYGALSRRSPEDMIAGARVEVAPFKKHPADFVLWKPSTDTQPGWDSPWGRGRPGWHIECSAMIERHLGSEIDIHGGGQDLIFPHHENEIAQGTRARYWIHNGFVTVDGRKMSKSLGNVLLVRDLLEEAPGEVIRYALLSAHYRQPLDWTRERLRQARRSLDRLYGMLRDVDAAPHAAWEPSILAPFHAALDDDLNTPGAFAELFRLAEQLHRAPTREARSGLRAALVEAGSMLGLLQQDPTTWFDERHGASSNEGIIAALVAQRDAARASRDFSTADRLRTELAKLGIAVEDHPEGAVWRRAS